MRQKRYVLGLLGLPLCFAVFGLMQISAPSLAHVINDDKWSTQLNAAEVKETTISSDLLKENGQTVILKAETEKIDIPIKIVSENVAVNEKINCSITLTPTDAEWITASADVTSLEINSDGENTINLSLEVKNSIEKEVELDGQTVTETVSRSTDTGVAVAVSYGEKTLTADFKIPLVNQTDDDTTGELSICPSLYTIEKPIVVKAGNDDCSINLGSCSFPAKTEYKINDESYLLYEGGEIFLNANEQAEIDLSKTGLNTTIEIVSNGENKYPLNYVEVSKLPEAELPVVVDTNGTVISVPYVWGSISPTIKIYQLTSEKTEEISVLKWTEVKTVNVTADASGGIKIVPNEAEAGSYKLSISWVENEITLHSMEIPFFVQYEAVNQGGTGQ